MIARLEQQLAELERVDRSKLSNTELRRLDDTELNLRQQINMLQRNRQASEPGPSDEGRRAQPGRAKNRSRKVEAIRQLGQARTLETDQQKAQTLAVPLGRLDRLGYDCKERSGRFTVTDRRTGERVGKSMDASELVAWAASFAS